MIEVRIPGVKLATLDHEIHRSMFILERLREANIPVLGALAVMGVEHGTLSWLPPDGGDYVFTWEPSSEFSAFA